MLILIVVYDFFFFFIKYKLERLDEKISVLPRNATARRWRVVLCSVPIYTGMYEIESAISKNRITVYVKR